MVEVDPGLDTRLRAFFDHYEGEAMPSRLTSFDEDAKSKRRTVVQFAAGAIGVAVIAAAAFVFAVELSNHNHTGQSPAAPTSVSWSKLPKLGASPPLPANYQTLVPMTLGKGSAALPSFTPTEHYIIQSACLGPGTFKLVGLDGSVIDDTGCGSRKAPVAMSTLYPPTEALGAPLTIRVVVDPSSIWEVLIVESSTPTPTLPAGFDTFTPPAGSKTLVAATNGTGTVTLPRFDPTERFYIVTTCTGGGSLVITSQPAQGGFPGSSSCLGGTGSDFFGPADEVMGEPLTLTVSAPASTSWEILVYETNQPQVGA